MIVRFNKFRMDRLKTKGFNTIQMNLGDTTVSKFDNLQDIEKYQRYLTKLKLLGIEPNIKLKVTDDNKVIIDYVSMDAQVIRIPDFVTLENVAGGIIRYSWEYPFSTSYKLREIYIDNKPGKPLSCKNAFRYLASNKVDIKFSHPEMVVDTGGMFYNSKIQMLYIQADMLKNVKDATEMFCGCQDLRSMSLDRIWDFQKLEIADRMFKNCSATNRLDISTWSQKNITSVKGMFSGCVRLQYLKLGQICLDKIQNLDETFKDCWALENLDFSKVQLKDNLTQMIQTFSNCEQIQELDLQMIDTSNVASFMQCFKCCNSLQKLDIHTWKFDKARNMQEMFSGCLRLQNLDTSRWNLSNVQYMTETFMRCWELRVIDQSHWRLDNIEDMSSCFRGCKSLKKLDTSMWNLPSDVNDFDMFNGCKFIDASSLY